MTSPHQSKDDQDISDGADAARRSGKLCLGDALPDVQDRAAGATKRGQKQVRRRVEVPDLPQHAPPVHLLHRRGPGQLRQVSPLHA